jgi:hypothetical protein
MISAGVSRSQPLIPLMELSPAAGQNVGFFQAQPHTQQKATSTSANEKLGPPTIQSQISQTRHRSPTNSRTMNNERIQMPESQHILLATNQGKYSAQIKREDCQSDSDFFDRLRRSYYEMRGPFRRWFAIWIFHHCEFVEVCSPARYNLNCGSIANLIV